MDYVLLKNGLVVGEQSIEKSDVLIGNNKIIAVEEKLSRPEPETPIIDAGGKYIFPGAVDTNVAFTAIGEQAIDKQRKLNQAEIMSGSTAMLEILEPSYSTFPQDELIHRKNEKISLIPDFGYHLSIHGWKEFDASEIDYCYSHEGITSFFIKWPCQQEFEKDSFNQMLDVIKQFDLLLVLEMQRPNAPGSGYMGTNHMFEEAIVQHLHQLRNILNIVAKADCKTLFLNICFAEELELIRQFSNHQRIYAELMLPCHLGDSSRFEVDEHTVFSGFPLIGKLNLISAVDFWDILKQEQFIISRPSFNFAGEGVLKDSQVHNRPDEFFLLKNFLSMVYTSGVITGKLSFTDFVDIVSARPARLMGLYPQKGVIRPGADADLVIWDPDFERNLYCNFPQMISTFEESLKLKGRAEFVFVKGQMAYNGENFFIENIRGRFLYRSPCQD